jgi:Vps52 / Sac2 family
MEETVTLNLGQLDLTSGEDTGLDGLEEMLAKYEHNEVVRDILRSEGAELRERASAVEGRLHQVELDSIQDYVAESDNLVALQEQIRGCDGILGKMEALLGGFQTDLGKISSEARAPACRVCARTRLTPAAQIKTLQEQSFTMSLKLRNRKAAEAQLGQFVEDISLPPKLISAIVEGEVREEPCGRLRCVLLTRSPLAQTNEAYVQYLVQLHNKLEFSTTKARRGRQRGLPTRAQSRAHAAAHRRVRAPPRCRTWRLSWSGCG